jgi:hypothetical protein
MDAMQTAVSLKAPDGIARGLTLRAALAAVALLVVGNLWIAQAELITVTCQVGMSIPPIPALAGLLFLLAVRTALGRFRGPLAFTRQELLVIYVFLSLGLALAAGAALRQLVPTTVVLEYFATPTNGWMEYREYVPDWLTPQGKDVVRTFFEGTEAGVPWKPWLIPLSAWTLFVVLLFAALHFMAELFVEPWSERERLGFPINELPLLLTQGPGHATAGLAAHTPGLWRDPVMWLGFTLVTIHNGLNMLHAFNPAIPALAPRTDIGQGLVERPWSGLQPLWLRWYPEVIGFGYLMPQEVILSALFAYFLQRVESVGAVALGYDIPRFPHLECQAAGAFIALALVLVWTARHHLQRVRAKRPGLLWGLGLSIAGVLAWWWAAGMAWPTAAAFFFLVFVFAFVQARLRCETGAPMPWAFPVTEQYRLLLSVFGSKAFAPTHSFRNLTLMSVGWFLARGYLPSLGSYHFEALQLARSGHVRHRDMVFALFAAILLGAAVSYAVQLRCYYGVGANFLEGGTHSGGMRISSATEGFKMLEDYAKRHQQPDWVETGAAVWGFVITLAFSFLRHVNVAFPIHPVGFALGTTRGYRSWASLLVAASAKSVALRLGGVTLYRRLIPAAIGVIIGHYIVAGGIWSLVAASGGEAYRGYQVWFD